LYLVNLTRRHGRYLTDHKILIAVSNLTEVGQSIQNGEPSILIKILRLFLTVTNFINDPNKFIPIVNWKKDFLPKCNLRCLHSLSIKLIWSIMVKECLEWTLVALIKQRKSSCFWTTCFPSVSSRPSYKYWVIIEKSQTFCSNTVKL
jgi:hypothetical protein